MSLQLAASQIHGHETPREVLETLRVGYLRLLLVIELPHLRAQRVLALHLLRAVHVGGGGIVLPVVEDGLAQEAFPRGSFHGRQIQLAVEGAEGAGGGEGLDGGGGGGGAVAVDGRRGGGQRGRGNVEGGGGLRHEIHPTEGMSRLRLRGCRTVHPGAGWSGAHVRDRKSKSIVVAEGKGR